MIPIFYSVHPPSIQSENITLAEKRLIPSLDLDEADPVLVLDMRAVDLGQPPDVGDDFLSVLFIGQQRAAFHPAPRLSNLSGLGVGEIVPEGDGMQLHLGEFSIFHIQNDYHTTRRLLRILRRRLTRNKSDGATVCLQSTDSQAVPYIMDDVSQIPF